MWLPSSGDFSGETDRPRRHPGPHGHRRSAGFRGAGHPGGGIRRGTGKGIPCRPPPGCGHRHPGHHGDRAGDPSGLCRPSPGRGCTGPVPGEITQIPPMYSAVKVGGKKLYELARKGKEVERQPRPITIEALDLLDQVSPTEYTLRVRCSKGTYVRTLCHDIGQALGCGGALFSCVEPSRPGFPWTRRSPWTKCRPIRPPTASAAGGPLLQPVSRPHPATWDRGKKLRNGNRLTLEGQDGVYRVYSRGEIFSP